MVSFKHTVTMETIECCNCGILFAIPIDKKRRLKETGDCFYCPSGHCQSYSKSEIDRLKEALQKEKSLRESAENDSSIWKSKFDVERKEKNRIKKRVYSGVCPCCNRHFKNLERHMQNKHNGI